MSGVKASSTQRWPIGPTTRDSASPSASPIFSHGRSKSIVSAFPATTTQKMGHHRNQSSTFPNDAQSNKLQFDHGNRQVQLSKALVSSPGTFAPNFIKTFDDADEERVKAIDGENDFSGKRYVWLRDPDQAFIKGWVVQNLEDGQILVQCDDGSQRTESSENVDKVNPAKFDRSDDMAELTHLNEPSVVHNLQTRYQMDHIYTYSGLFLVAVNPYCPLSIYSREYINMYRNRSREDTKPHIFALADEAFRNLVDEGENQSLLVTGESGAGKTENTKKIIQYLAAVAAPDAGRPRTPSRQQSNLSEQILRANPILEAFGNAQTVRNNNSSRFGKFIRIEFSRSGQIAGAFIEWYLLEKSRVVHVNRAERNYHVFYQLLRGANNALKQKLLLEGRDVEDFEYTRNGNDSITGVSDRDEWNMLIEAFQVMGFTENEQHSILRTISAILHLGNITVVPESKRGDQAALESSSKPNIDAACRLLGIDSDAFVKGLLHPRVKAGREWVEKVQTPDQVRLAIDALSKGIYERGFGDLVSRINRQLDRGITRSTDSNFIGVLDIAGFEIFQENSFEQLCINYTNEKLQQFFNHHMFVLEQEEYAREQIEWNFIDFGKDLQPTIDLIELSNPIGIFSCLDEDCVMPRATDKSFTEKLNSLWERKTPKYHASKLNQGFLLTHYAAEVEYSTEGWLEKNKDPLNDNVTRLLADSSDLHVATLFADCAETEEDFATPKSRVKKGLFRTVAQRHKEQLSTLMTQLHSTRPHFVRCILPNHRKKAKLFQAQLVLDQLRCNGVLEGIRIARTGFPNRLPFAEFRARYEVLCQDMPKGFLEAQIAAKIILEKLSIDPALYRVGLTKVFFRAGILAELEEQRDALIAQIVSRFQCVARGYTQRRIVHKRLYRAEAAKVISQNFQAYLRMQANPWWRLYVRMRPLLGATMQANEVKKRDEEIKKLVDIRRQDAAERQKLDEDRRRAEQEIDKIQKILESERALALDKEEIFRRLQEREAELEEKLAGAIDDQESLEDQIDQLVGARKETEETLQHRVIQLEQAGLVITRLETDKDQLRAQISELEENLSETEKTKNVISEVEERLNQEIKILKSNLALKERKIGDLEGKLVKVDHDIQIELATAVKDLQNTRKQAKDLADDNLKIRNELAELSSTSTSFEDLIRRKDCELAVVKSDLKKLESDRQSFDLEKRSLATKHEDIQSRLREAKADVEKLRVQNEQISRQLLDANKALQNKVTEAESRKLLESQLDDVKTQLAQAQSQLTRERQSRDDVQMLGEHKYNNLKREYDNLNEAKITIEKEMYTQQDVIRRATDGRSAAETERKEFQSELTSLRKKFLELQEAKIEAETAAEQRVAKQATDKQTVLRGELERKDRQLSEVEEERATFSVEVQRLKKIISDSESFRSHNDQHKERLERELVTVKGRLTASENDNRALLNKVQQKNLDIARSSSRASEASNARATRLAGEKLKLEDDNRHLRRQLDDAQLSITSLEKQKEKLALSLEDLNHEVTREHKASRNAEQASSTVHLQLAEANRKLEIERQLKSQAQTNCRTIQNTLESTNNELSEAHEQLTLLQKVFDPNSSILQGTPSQAGKPKISGTIEVARRLETMEIQLRQANERTGRAETQLDELRLRFADELNELDNKHTASRRAILEEMDDKQVNSRQQSPIHFRKDWETRKTVTPLGTPTRRPLGDVANDSARSDRTTDLMGMNSRADLAADLELVQNQLQMSELRNKHLQAEVDRHASKSNWDDSPSLGRVKKLERENSRLHDLLDDSAKKVSALEHGIHTRQLSFKEVQAKSHEELYDLINSQEQSRRSLLQAHNSSVAELAEAKSLFEDLKRAKTGAEVELRDVRFELADLREAREQESANHAQLLQEFSDLQLRLDSETSMLQDSSSSLNLYKARADEYFGRLEQAEIAVLKAKRAEQFAKEQAKEAEESYSSFIAERRSMEVMIEDLQRQTQQHEERVDDISADLEGAILAKKRLQNELEDYRSQRAMDIEDKETSMEQTRKKYQTELSSLTTELDVERENLILSRTENSRMRDELEDLRAKWDDEVLNSSTWAKEKARLEVTLQDLTHSREEAVSAHNDAQTKIVNLLSQVRSLRTSVDDSIAERDNLVKEKKNLETRLTETMNRLDDVAAKSDSPTKRQAAEMDRDLLELKSCLAQQEDIAAAAVGKMRRAEALSLELQRDLGIQRDANVQLHQQKAALEKQAKDLQLKCVDFETKSYSKISGDVRFLNNRIQELEKQLESQESLRTTANRDNRAVDRTIKDLQAQLERKDKAITQMAKDLDTTRAKVARLLSNIDELQQSDSTSQLAQKRVERELREEREKGLRLERELEGWKGLRMERDSVRRSGTLAPLSDADVRSRKGSVRLSTDMRRISGSSFL